jgi:hypothetical protein
MLPECHTKTAEHPIPIVVPRRDQEEKGEQVVASDEAIPLARD